LFFFSSRRRHTRFSRDWSSDVCSSDLGEFDATNLVMPEVSVITSIGLDHCEWLGNTIADVARAKAGIIKPGRPVVIGRLPSEARSEERRVGKGGGCGGGAE